MPRFDNPNMSTDKQSLKTGLYDQQEEQASAPNIEFIPVFADKEKIRTPVPKDHAEAIKKNLPEVNKETIEQFMQLMHHLKKKESKLSHNERIEILADVMGCSQKEAKTFYKGMKIWYKFLVIKRKITKFFSN